MKLLTKEILDLFEKTGRQDIPDPLIICRFFNPGGAWTWLALEYEPTEKIFFWYASLWYEFELGSFSLIELESFRGRFWLRIERDLHFSPKKASEIDELREGAY